MKLRIDGFATEVVFGHDLTFPRPEDARRLAVFDRKTRVLFGGGEERVIVIPRGERGKSWRTLLAAQRAAVRRGLTRGDLMIGVGGGAVCDLTALAASLYMRGCRLILIPTTLLAMVDAAVGGKTGVNFRGLKNMIGSFYPAEEVRICISAIRSLPEGEYRNGLAEVIKTALLGEPDLYGILEKRREAVLSRDPDLMLEIIRRCVALKGGIVERDLREGGLRAQLNLGHTFGHALEAVGRLRGRSHGEAVGWGIAKAMDLGVRLEITDPEYAEEVKRLLSAYGFRLSLKKASASGLLDAMRSDKKRRDENLRFVLQRRFGETVVEDVRDADVIDLLLQESS